MIRGVVTAQLEAWIDLDVVGRDDSRIGFSAVIDTGFNGFLTLPHSVLSSLGCRKLGEALVSLADGSEIQTAVFQVTVFWNGQPRKIEVDAAEVEPLVGMRMLKGHDVHLQVVPNGDVTVSPLAIE